MAIYSSGSLHFSGLGSELDVDELITNLYKIESKHANQLLEWQSDWQTRLDAFQQVRSQLLSLQTTLQSMNTLDKFLVKNANSSDSSVAAATVTGDVAEGVYNVEVNQLATNSIWSIDTGLASKDTQVNDSGSEGSFTYTYKGETYTVKVPTGTTLEGLKNLINNSPDNPGVKAQLVSTTGGVNFQLRSMETGAAASLEIDSTTNLNGMAVSRQDTWLGGGSNTLTSYNAYTSATAVLNSTETPKSFVFSVNGEEHSVNLAAGGTLTDLRDAINAKTGETGVSANVVYYDIGGTTYYSLRMNTSDSADVLEVGAGTLEGYANMSEAANWHVQRSQNAEIRVDGWPSSGWLERDSNAVDDVVDGLTFNLRSKGTSVLTVELDTAAMEANIEKFVQEVNNFRTLLQSLTAVDSEKTTVDPDYATSQFDMQMGGVLTGTYGIQLLSSQLKTLIAGQAVGFTYQYEAANGKTMGDIFSTLSQIGITTDANQGSSTYGLLVINEVEGQYGSLTLTEALKKDPVAVAKLFAVNSEGSSDSASFAYNSHVKSITKSGVYDVSYSTDASGNILSATINGKEAKIDQETRQIAIYSNHGEANDADGIILDIYDLTPGQTFNGTVSIRNGKINELLELMDGSQGLLGEEGTLKILENNYKTIIQNIETKIAKEDERLAKWETSMRAKFARLESVLATYNTINSNLESQLSQLSTSS